MTPGFGLPLVPITEQEDQDIDRRDPFAAGNYWRH